MVGWPQHHSICKFRLRDVLINGDRERMMNTTNNLDGTISVDKTCRRSPPSVEDCPLLTRASTENQTKVTIELYIRKRKAYLNRVCARDSCRKRSTVGGLHDHANRCALSHIPGASTATAAARFELRRARIQVPALRYPVKRLSGGQGGHTCVWIPISDPRKLRRSPSERVAWYELHPAWRHDALVEIFMLGKLDSGFSTNVSMLLTPGRRKSLDHHANQVAFSFFSFSVFTRFIHG